MIRSLVILGLLVVAILLIRRLWQINKPPAQSEPKQQRMLRCDHCGVHFPENEAVKRNDKTFCSTAHAQLDDSNDA